MICTYWVKLPIADNTAVSQSGLGRRTHEEGVGAAILAAAFAYSVLPASAYTQLFAFGDSLSDAGNLFQVTGSPAAPLLHGAFQTVRPGLRTFPCSSTSASSRRAFSAGMTSPSRERRAERPTPTPIFFQGRRPPIRLARSTSMRRSRLTRTYIKTRFQAPSTRSTSGLTILPPHSRPSRPTPRRSQRSFRKR